MSQPGLETIRQTIETSLNGVESWVERHDYRGYEPFDGLSSWFRPLTFRNLLAERILQQLIRQSPINLRPIMGVTRKDSTKGRGYMAYGYLLRYKKTGKPEYLAKAEACLDWLDHHKEPRFKQHSWSNHFDFSSRGGSYSKHDPIIVWTSLITLTYLEAYEQTGKQRWLEIADSACQWIMALPREKTPTGTALSYLMELPEYIHNASMLGAAALARMAKNGGKKEYAEVARSAMEYSCSRQRPDGSWWYAEDPMFRWIDNFHTGYNLDSLKCYIVSTGDETWRPNLLKGLEYYKANFFESDGCPKYYHDRKFPVDSQCASQSVETLAEFSDLDPSCLDLAIKVALWIIENMQDPDGHFYYRIYPAGIKAKTAMLHWAQATMYKGFTRLLIQLDSKNKASSQASVANGSLPRPAEASR